MAKNPPTATRTMTTAIVATFGSTCCFIPHLLSHASGSCQLPCRGVRAGWVAFDLNSDCCSPASTLPSTLELDRDQERVPDDCWGLARSFRGATRGSC